MVPALALRGVLVTVFSFLSKVFSLYDTYAKGEDHRFIKKRSARGGGNAGWPWMARRIASATTNKQIDWRKYNASISFVMVDDVCEDEEASMERSRWVSILIVL